jgi:hypothetical protein
MTRTFKYFVCIQTTDDGRRWGISASGIGLFPDAHQVGKMISIYKECTPCDENGKVIAHVEPYKPISGQQTDGGHEQHTQSPFCTAFTIFCGVAIPLRLRY